MPERNVDHRTKKQIAEDQDVINQAVEISRLGVEGFARLSGRDERTIRRWRNGSLPIPPAAARWLRRYLATNHDTRQLLAAVFD